MKMTKILWYFFFVWENRLKEFWSFFASDSQIKIIWKDILEYLNSLTKYFKENLVKFFENKTAS